MAIAYFSNGSSHGYGPLTRYVKLRVAHAPGMPRTFSPPPRVSDPDMYHGTCVTHVPWCMPGSLTSGFLWSRWRGKHCRHSRRMRDPQSYVSGKRPIAYCLNVSSHAYCILFEWVIAWLLHIVWMCHRIAIAWMGHHMAIAYCLNGSSHSYCILFEWVIAWLLHIVRMGHRVTVAYCLNGSSPGCCTPRLLIWWSH